MFDWHKLKNPVHSVVGESIKDFCCARLGDSFFIFYSAFYEEQGKLYCAVCEIQTEDFLCFSEPLLWLGPMNEFKGYCSPDISRVGDTFYLTLNTWGDVGGQPNQLWFTSSTDLANWDSLNPLAQNLTREERAIDAALGHYDDGWRLMWKGHGHQTTIAFAKDITDDFDYIDDGLVTFCHLDGSCTHVGHENYQFLTIDGTPHLLTTCFAAGHLPVLYRQGTATDWLSWYEVRTLHLPEEYFNTFDLANASTLYDWRAYDDHYYLLYAGTTECETFKGDAKWGRGWNVLGLARSKDLIHWAAAGKDDA